MPAHVTWHVLVACRDCILDEDCLLPIAGLPKLCRLQLIKCQDLTVGMLRRFLRRAVQGSSLVVEIERSGISDQRAQMTCNVLMDKYGAAKVPCVEVTEGDCSDGDEDDANHHDGYDDDDSEYDSSDAGF
jgi:hypothetical protein